MFLINLDINNYLIFFIYAKCHLIDNKKPKLCLNPLHHIIQKKYVELVWLLECLFWPC